MLYYVIRSTYGILLAVGLNTIILLYNYMYNIVLVFTIRFTNDALF